MNIIKLSDINVTSKKVIVRMDLDVTDDYTRIETAKDTLKYLVDNKAKIIIIGHKGRPEGKIVKDLSLEPLAKVISGIIGSDVKFIANFQDLKDEEIVLLENLRFDARESFDPAQDAGAEEFSKELAALGDIYVNEAFAVSHRAHASIVGIPKLLPHAAGFRFGDEIEHLSRVIENPDRPLVFLISGIKKDKLEMIEAIKKLADKVLVAGRLPDFMAGD